MAYLTVDARFNPYTFDELVRPFAMYDAAYQQSRAMTDELLEKATTLDDLSPEIDKDTYDAYQEWKGRLKATSDELASQGLNTAIRRDIDRLNTDYRSSYLPTVSKIKTRGDLIKEQREYLQKHPNAFFDIDYSTTPIDQVTSSSSYNVYDLDEIAKNVATETYSRLAAGQPESSTEDYMSRFGNGQISDAQRVQISNAINSGKALAAANYKQKEFENYMTQVRATKTGRTSSGGSSRSSAGSVSGGENDFNLQLPDGRALPVKYNKKTKEYEYKDNRGQFHSIKKDELSTDRILTGYYGGMYGTPTIGGRPVRRVLGEDGTYTIVSNAGKPITLPNGGDTTYRDYLKAVTGQKEISEPTKEELGKTFSTWNSRAYDKGKYTNEEVSLSKIDDYSANPNLKNLVGKLQKLRDLDILDSGTTLYIFRDKDGRMVGYNTDLKYKGGIDLNAPIEKGWEDTLKAEIEARKITEKQGKIWE